MSSTDSDDDCGAFVFDIGSCNTKMGYAGDDAPLLLIKSNISSTKPQKDPKYVQKHDCYVDVPDDDDSACYPVNRMEGQGSDFDKMESLILHCFDKANAPEDVIRRKPVLCTEHVVLANKEREKLMELMFEKFPIPAYFVAQSAVLSLYSSGRGSGIVVESGHSCTETLIIYEGYCVSKSSLHADVGGRTVAKSLSDMCPQLSFGKASYLAGRYGGEEFADIDMDIDLPDGSKVTLRNKEILKCTDGMFDFSLYHEYEHKSIQDMIYKSIMSADIQLRKDLFSNIILSGGNTLISGFPERLQREFTELAQPKHKNICFKIVAPPERKFSPWIGGSILASLSTFQNSYIERAMYEEHGPAIIHEKCETFSNTVLC